MSASAAVSSSASIWWTPNSLLSILGWTFLVLRRKHAGEETGAAAVGDDDDVCTRYLVMPSLAFVVEDDPYQADAKGDEGHETAYGFTWNGEGNTGLVPFLIDNRYTGNPFADGASEKTGREYEVCEKDCDFEYATSRVKIESNLTRSRIDDEFEHQKQPDVHTEGVDAP